jgi:ABC-type branched-subunit amino acid transport system substrate-binding protein
MTELTIAVSANFVPGASVHGATFSRAIEMAASWIKQKLGVNLDLIWVDDAANAEGGGRAAEIITRSRAKAVVGHFASSAALAAAPIYARAGLPLFLPAATNDRLNTFGNVFRLCDSDQSRCAWIADWLDRHSYSKIYLKADGSLHGESVRRALLGAMPPHRVTGDAALADAILFSGLFGPSLSFTRAHMLSGDVRPVFLTDDAQAQGLTDSIGDLTGEVYVFGLRTDPPTDVGEHMQEIYLKKWQENPGAYFFETIAALQAAAAAVAQVDPHARSCETVLGATTFDARGESYPRRVATFQATPGGLVRLDP